VVLAVDSAASAFYQFEYAPTDGDLRNIPSSSSDWDRLTLKYTANTSGIASVILESNGNFASAVATYNPGTQSLEFLYGDFAGDPIDFADIDGILLSVAVAGQGAGGPASLSLSFFGPGGAIAIPEPSAVGLLGTVLLTLAGVRRRRLQ
jgi:hypothetical protein